MFWQELRFEWYRSVFLLLTIFWIYELKSSKGKRINDKDVNVLTETSVYSEPFSVLSYYKFTESTRDYFWILPFSYGTYTSARDV